MQALPSSALPARFPWESIQIHAAGQEQETINRIHAVFLFLSS
jgi:hypothetical protein